MKDMKKYYLALAILIPVYIAVGFVASRDNFFNIFNIILVVVWAAAVFAWHRSRNFRPAKKK